MVISIHMRRFYHVFVQKLTWYFLLVFISKYGHGELDTHHPNHATVYNVIYIKSLLIRVNVSIIHLVVIIKQTLLAKQGRNKW